jgi:hypothetical protein
VTRKVSEKEVNEDFACRIRFLKTENVDRGRYTRKKWDYVVLEESAFPDVKTEDVHGVSISSKRGA